MTSKMIETNSEQDRPVVPDYQVALPLYEGPLDLLLHLIKKNDLEITDIPISTILEQYLEYLRMAKDLNIDLAGEFLDMVAELAWIKSKMLLPEPPEEEEETGPDPREDLAARLLEYQQFKQAAGWLVARPMLGRDVFSRGPLEVDGEVGTEGLIEADTMTLLSAFADILRHLPAGSVHEIRSDRMGVTEKVLELMGILEKKGPVTFESLFEGLWDREGVIVTFLAILEMAKQRIARIVQARSFQTIIVDPLFEGDNGQSAVEANP